MIHTLFGWWRLVGVWNDDSEKEFVTINQTKQEEEQSWWLTVGEKKDVSEADEERFTGNDECLRDGIGVDTWDDAGFNCDTIGME